MKENTTINSLLLTFVVLFQFLFSINSSVPQEYDYNLTFVIDLEMYSDEIFWIIVGNNSIDNRDNISS